MTLILAVTTLLLACLGLAWFFVPIFSGIPWVPSSQRRIRKALELAQLQPGEHFYDLGCGDGRVLIEAARIPGVLAVGIEISPLHCLYARVRTLAAGVGKRTRIRWGNFRRLNLADADVVYQYGHSRYAEHLKEQLGLQLKQGARVVSINLDLPGWQPEAFDRQQLIYLYRMPPVPGDIASFLMRDREPDPSRQS
jgi:SAM-dependent methyltransferase